MSTTVYNNNGSYCDCFVPGKLTTSETYTVCRPGREWRCCPPGIPQELKQGTGCVWVCLPQNAFNYVLLLFIQDLPRGVFCCGLSSIKIVDLTSTVDGGNHASFMASITHAVNYCDQCVAQQRRHTQTPQHGGRKTIQDQARLIVTLFYGCC